MQGFGNVGSHSAAILAKHGVSTIAVGDHSGYLYNPEGFNAGKLAAHVKTHGSIGGYDAGQPISREEFFKIKGDIFVPAALENTIGAEEAPTVRRTPTRSLSSSRRASPSSPTSSRTRAASR